MDARKYLHAGLGGTFDRLHSGHKKLIDTALEVAEKISVGITINSFTKDKKYAEIIEKYEQRKTNLENYYRAQLLAGRMSTFPLKDAFGPTLSDNTIDCLVVTEHTLPGAEAINQKRANINLRRLPVIEADLIKDDEGEYISSTRIRMGLIGRDGKVYNKLFEKTIILSSNQRQKLKAPYGKIIAVDNLQNIITTMQPTQRAVVGDTTLSTFIQQNILVDIGVYDEVAQREPTKIVLESLERKKNTKYTQNFITNNAGEISQSAVKNIRKILNKSLQLIKVAGEEDLLVIPLALLMPLQSVIFYGQPEIGIVMIEVTEKSKETIMRTITS